MSAFSKGEIDLLCSTTVVEVGVDVPNAVLMIIENAERYGLSALHQLRGRVGRGTVQSYCILVSDNRNPPVQERLRFMVSHNSGFDVAQFDLQHRGPGDFFGSRQHGLPAMKTANLTADVKLLDRTKAAGRGNFISKPGFKTVPRCKQKCAKLFESLTL